MMPDYNRVTDAVNVLIFSEKYTELKAELTKIIEEWDTHPMAYGGKLACLNELVNVGIAKRASFDKLIQLVEDNRELIPQSTRVKYQREYMQTSRERVRKAVSLYVMQKGPLNAASRKKYISDLKARWMAAQEKFLAAKGEITWKERNEARAEFWAEIDATLDKNLAAEGAKKRL